MKFQASKIKLLRTEEETLIQFTATNKYIAKMAYEEIKNNDLISVEAKKGRASRSLNQNRMLWSLLNKLSLALNGSQDKDHVEKLYCDMLELANVESNFILAPEKAEKSLRKQFRAFRYIDKRNIKNRNNEQIELNMYQVWIGSSKFDTKQMTELIELVLNKCAEYGIVDSEIETIRSEL